MSKTPRKSVLRRLVSELRRRHVPSVAVAYAVVSWVLIEVADVVFPALHLPEWTITLVVVLVLLGFPLAILLSWVFDLTPEGFQRTPSADAEAVANGSAESSAPSPVAAASREVSAPIHTDASEPQKGTVAVLPFVNMSGDEENEYFSDGLTEELLDALSKVPGLRVAARTSSFALKGKNEDIRAIGRKLSVAHVVEGSVRQSGSRLRITAQLIGVADGFHMWSESFDREVRDVFATQEEISRAIVAALRIKVVGHAEEQLLMGRRTENLEAHKLYLKGRYFWNKRGIGLQKGIEYFERSIAEDPEYAQPYAGLADCLALMGYYGFLPPNAAFPKAKASAMKALELDDSLVEARTSLAFVNLHFDWDREAADRNFQEALALNPSYPPAIYWYAVSLSSRGRHEEALAQDIRAMEVDPVSVFVNVHHGWTLRMAGRHQEAIEQLESTRELDPNSVSASWMLSYAYSEAGRHDDALSTAKLTLELAGGKPLFLPPLGYAYAMAGDHGAALNVLEEIEASAAEEFVWPSHVALVQSLLGEREAAFASLQRALEVRDHWLITATMDPAFASLREDGEFEEILAGAGLLP